MELFFRANLFDLLNVAQTIEIDGYEIDQVNDCGVDASGNPVLRCECDADNEWHFADQEVKVRYDDGGCVATTAAGDWDGAFEAKLTFAMSRPIALHDITDSAYTELAIAAIPLVEDADLEPEDDHVAAVYSVMVRKSLSVHDRASAALDVFHGNVAVGTLDDFEFYVFEPATGIVLEEADDNEIYTKEGLGRDLQRISDELPEIYTVQIEAVNDHDAHDAMPLGRVTVAAASRLDADAKALTIIWGAHHLGALPCSPRYETKRLR